MKPFTITFSAGAAVAIIALLIAAGCTSQQPGSPTQGADFSGYVLRPDELSSGLTPIAQAPMGANDINAILKMYGLQDGYRVLYQYPVPKPTTDGIIEQDIIRFPPGNASAITDAFELSFQNMTSSGKVLPLPDPGIGEKSFAVKISTGGTGKSTYIIVFVKSGLFEQFTLAGAPDDYRNLVKLADVAETNIR